MRIDPTTLAPIVERTLPEISAQRPALEQEAAVVTLSSAGAAVAAGSTGEVATARLEQLRLQLERGEYTIDLDKLAARIAEDDLDRSARFK